jgi:hypothetical protein
MTRTTKSAIASPKPSAAGRAAVLVDPTETASTPPPRLTTFERPAAPPPAFLQGEGTAFGPPRPLPIVPADILDRFHANEPFDTRFSSGARLLQSIWRERRGLPMGKIKPENGRRRPLGSRLTPEVARTGVNFLTPEIAKLVRREAAYREYGAFIQEERLWGNLLSSQPLAFNRFGRAKLDRSIGSKLFRAILPDFVAELETIHFETSPGRGDERFTGDNTAFDLLATVTTPRGTRGLVGIEVKFVESLKYRARPMTKRVDELADQANLYRDPRTSALRDVPLEQLFRLHLLAVSMISHSGPFQEGMFVLVAPEGNRNVARAAEAYRGHLREEHATTVAFRQASIETCIEAIGAAGDAELSAALHERYIDLEPIHALIADWQPYQLPAQD